MYSFYLSIRKIPEENTISGLKRNLRHLILLCSLMMISVQLHSQLYVTTGYTPEQYVANIIGGGVTYFNVTYSCNSNAIGMFTTGSNPTNLGFDNGIILSTGLLNGVNQVGSAASNFMSSPINCPGDPQLQALINPYTITEATKLEFNFIPVSDTIRFKYIFASEEYHEWVGSAYNDVFGFFLSGPNPGGGNYSHYNLARIPGSSTPVAINTVNNGHSYTSCASGPCNNCAYFVDNCNGTSIIFDGFTAVLTAWAVVVPCQTYHIKLAIGDAGDRIFDSGVFLLANSFTSPTTSHQVNYPMSAEIGDFALEGGCNNPDIIFSLPGSMGSDYIMPLTFSGNAVKDTDYIFPDTVIIPAGSTSVSIPFEALADGLIEGTETVIIVYPNSFCSFDTIYIDIHDYIPPSVIVTPPVDICEGQSTTLSVTIYDGYFPYSILWSNGDTTDTQTISPAVTTVFEVMVKDLCNIEDTAQTLVTVHENPQIIINSDGNNICQGTSVILTADSNIPLISWQWNNSLNDTSITVFPDSTTTYTVIGTTPEGCSSSADITISVHANPVPVINGPSSICISGSAVLIAVNGMPGIIWEWNTGQTTDQINVSPTSNTTYSVTATTPMGCTASVITLVEVFPNPVVSVSATSTNICQGSPTTITAVSNIPGSTFIWNSSHTTNQITVSPNSTRFYRVTATTANGCTGSAGLWIYVSPAPTINISTSSPQICEQDSSVITVIGNTNGMTWNWNNGETNDTIIVFPAVTSTYSVSGTTPIGCSSSAQITITVNQLPIIQINNPIADICYGESVSIEAASSVTGTTWLWNIGHVGNPLVVIPTMTTTYSVTGTTPDGCSASANTNITVLPVPLLTLTASETEICPGDTVNINVSSDIAGTSFEWNSGETTPTIIVFPDVTTTYTVTGTSPLGCSTIASITIQVHDKPVEGISAMPMQVCLGDSTTLTALTSIIGTTFLWSTGDTTNSIVVAPVVTTSYSVTGTSPIGCTGSAEIEIIVNPIPIVIANPDSSLICPGDTLSLHANSDITGTTWTWSSGDTSNPAIVNPNTTTTYTVTGTTPQGCTASSQAQVNVYPNPLDSIISSANAICIQDSITLTAIGNIAGTQWVWSTGDTLNPITVFVNATTTYSVTATSTDDCTVSAEITIQIQSDPNMYIQSPSLVVCDLQTIELTAMGDVSMSNWLWSTGDTVNPITVTPSVTTAYSVTGTTSSGCSSTAQITITVLPQPQISVMPSDYVICFGDSVVINAFSDTPGTIWLWNNGLTNNPIIVYPDTTSVFSVTGTTPEGCTGQAEITIFINDSPVENIISSIPVICNQDTAVLTAIGSIPGTTWLWSTNETGNPIIVSPGVTSDYSVTGTSPLGCTGVAQIQVGVYPQPNITAFTDTTDICSGTAVNIYADSSIPGITWLWNTGDTLVSFIDYPVSSTTYTVTGTSPDGCAGTAQVTVNVFPNPVGNISATATEICEQDSVTLTANGGGVGTVWQWSTGDLTNPLTIYPAATSTYSVTATSIEGCTGSTEIMITVQPYPVDQITVQDQDICVGQQTILTANTNVSGTIWSWNTGQSLQDITVNPLTTTIYTLTGTSPIGCSGSAAIQINVHPLPLIDITSSSPEICIGESVNLTAQSDISGTTWLWSTGDTANPVNDAPSMTTIYQVTGTTPYGCTGTSSIFVIVQRYPIDSLWCAASEVCTGDTAHILVFTSTAGTTFQWNTGSTTNPLVVTPTAVTTYTVTGTTPQGCVGTADIQLVVHPYPVINLVADDQEICFGDSTSIHASADIPVANWLWNTGEITQMISVDPVVTSIYSVTGSTAFGCAQTVQIPVTVNQLPVDAISASSAEICVGEYVSLTAIENVPGSTWLWNTGETLQTILVAPNLTSTYSVTGTSPAGCISSTQSQIVVNPVPVITSDTQQNDLCQSETTILSASGDIGNLVWSWNTGQTTQNISVSPNVTTVYTVSGTTSSGCYGTAEITINVYPLPAIQATTPPGNYCAGSERNILVTSDILPVDWVWNTGEIQSSIQVFPTQATTYSVTATSAYGCTASTSIHLQTVDLPVVTVTTMNTNICFGNSASLLAVSNAPGATYLWSDGCMTNVNNIQPAVSQSYNVTVTDVFGCAGTAHIDISVLPLPQVSINPAGQFICNGTVVQLSAQSNHPNTNFLWSNYMVASEIAVNPSTSTMYSVTGTDANGCTGIAYSIVNVLAVPQITATPPNLTVCSETQVTVSAQSNMTGTSFQWNNGATIDMFVVTPLTTTTYTVTGTAPNGCSGTAQAQINVQSAPQITILPDNPHICIGESLTLIALGANQFDWMPAVQYDLPNGSQVTVTPDFTTHYLVQGTDAYGCTGEALATVTVHQPPQVDFTTDMTTKCAGTPVQYFSVCHPENEIDSYLWNFGNPSSGQGNTSGVANPDHTYNLPGTYWVSLEVTSIYGCTVTVAKPDFVCVYPNPVAGFTRTPDITDLSSPLVSVFNQAIGITDLLYDFGDPEAGTDNFSTSENAVHEYTKPGEYRIWQFVTNEWGCVDSASNRVIIQPSWEIYIPNAFTPNADGINDYFFPSGFGVETDYFEMFIYTRWGEEIFNTKNVNEGWNGSVKNGSAIAKPDVYVYVIKIRDAFGHDRQFVGNITVLR